MQRNHPQSPRLAAASSRRSRSESSSPRTICFVTGTRAEFGLMQSTLRAIQNHPNLKLHIIATGMHLSRSHGNTIDEIRRQFRNISVVNWPQPARNRVRGTFELATATGHAISDLSKTFANLNPDIVLIVGDRVEAFAAASAAHISGIPIAHIHGGDRALGQIDDSLRHAIAKLSHIHFPATKSSAHRIARLGEDPWRIHLVGSPAIDNIKKLASTHHVQGKFALMVLHPTQADESLEYRRTAQILRVLNQANLDHIVIIYPNNDPGHKGILRAYSALSTQHSALLFPSIARSEYLALLRDCQFLIGNSSSGIIEAASFNTPVIDTGPRQLGRERAGNVVHVDYNPKQITSAIKRLKRTRVTNPYGGGNTSQKIASLLASIKIDEKLMRKLIAY